MKVSKEYAVNEVRNIIRNEILDTQKIQTWIQDLYELYNVPESVSHDLLTLRKDLEFENEYIIYVIIKVINPDRIPSFFTDIEIKEFNNTKYEIETVTYPIEFDALQVAPDQWISVINIKQLMLFRDAQLINYNENTQRTLKHMINGQWEYWAIDLNKNQVKAIQKSMHDHQYISDTLTLNMPEATDFTYDEKRKKLVINKIDTFDILDGYHRYIAASSEYNLNNDFDYPMELRVVYFSENRAKNFIFQQDQKTKMTRRNSQTFNQADGANQAMNLIIQACNEYPELQGVITSTQGIIDKGVLADLIRKTYYAKTSEKHDVKYNYNVRNEIINMLRAVFEEDMDIYSTTWKMDFTVFVFVAYIYAECRKGQILKCVKKLEEINEDKRIYLESITRKRFNKWVEEIKKEDL